MTMASCRMLHILILLYHLVRSEFVHFKHCGGVNSIMNVRLEPCETTFLEKKKLVCVLVQGSEVEYESVFIPPINSSRVAIKTVATIKGEDVKIPDPGTEPCKFSLYPNCPLIERQLYSFSRVYNLKMFPMGPVKIKLTLRDRETKKILACAKLLVFIV